MATLARHAGSLIYDVDSNIVESYNNVIAKFIGGKRINYTRRRSYQGRCAAAVISFNTKKLISTSRKTLCDTDEADAHYVRKYETKTLLQASRRKSKPKKFIKKNKNKSDENYGENCQKPDMSKEEYDVQANILLSELQKTSEEINEIERATCSQRSSNLWHTERRKRLTASWFSKVCKMRETTSCQNLVKSILSGHEIFAKSLEWGKTNEAQAIEELGKLIHKNIQPCGLFIDKNNSYLAATPDGLIDDDGIVEIKCPYSARNLTPEQAITEKKIIFWLADDTINVSHQWYFQIQGQLKITKKKYCVFAVWTLHGIKLSTILADEHFWQKMEPKLSRFYYHCLLPELVDSRLSRSMNVREPEYILKAIENKAAAKKRKLT